MVCKCPNCDGALEYNPSYAEMECPFCGNTFEPQVAMQAVSRAQTQVEEPQIIHKTADDTQEMMECKIYVCTACGGELMVNDVEASTFCSYCGQPTVVFSRVSKERKPKFIIPFKITKNQAMEIFNRRVAESKFLPDEAIHIQPDKVRGIYVPYYIHDIYFRTRREFFKGQKVYVREADCLFQDLYLEVSSKIDDMTSQFLEPFDLKELKPFEPAYLSGFYADKYDVEYGYNTDRLVNTIDQLVYKEIRKSVKDEKFDHRKHNEHYEVKRNDYAFFPIWFITFRYQNEPFTLMINGQTGKIVGSLPIDKKKVIKQLVLITSIAGFLSLGIMGITMLIPPLNFLVAFIANLFLYIFGLAEFVRAYRNIKATKDKKTAEFVEKRQEDT